MRLRALAVSSVVVLLCVGGTAVAAPLAPSRPTTGTADVQPIHRGPGGGWHCNRERWSKALGWHYHSRRCSAWVPTNRFWQGKRWRKGCWINRRGTLVCRF